jgi:hypothetical protein
MEIKKQKSMKLFNLKPGNKITHYCYGNLVEGTVIEVTEKYIKTQHEPVQWGKETTTQTTIHESSYLQKMYGGTDKHGHPTKGPDTTPGSFYNGERITI